MGEGSVPTRQKTTEQTSVTAVGNQVCKDKVVFFFINFPPPNLRDSCTFWEGRGAAQMTGTVSYRACGRNVHAFWLNSARPPGVRLSCRTGHIVKNEKKMTLCDGKY